MPLTTRRLWATALRSLLAAAVIGAFLAQPASRAKALPPPTDFYGLNFVTPFEPWVPIALETGARTMRWQFSWRDHEIAPGEWIWTPSDTPMTVWHNAGFQVHAILHNPPDFWLANPGTGSLVPRGYDLAWDDPNNGWGHWCYTFASRYKDTVASYEIWNEPDLSQYWNRSARDYYKLMRTCYQAIKAADPEAGVSMGSMALLVNPGFFPAVVQAAKYDPGAAEHNYYFDGVSVHAFMGPELSYSLPVKARTTLARYGMADKPIWLTETGVPVRGYGVVSDEPGWDRATEDEQAWYMLQSISNAHAGGASRLMVYRFADDFADHAFGLIRVDLSRRPSYWAFSTAVNVMRDIVSSERTIVGGDVVINEMRRADGIRIVTVYSRSGHAAEVTIPSGKPGATLINAAGEFGPLAPNIDGFYHITLPEAPGRDFTHPDDYSMGGPVLIIVE